MIDGLDLPARDRSTMLRVSGMLVAPVDGDYAFSISGPDLPKFERPDESELWIRDAPDGGWRLAQCTGNPVKNGGRTRLEAGEPKHFELWTMGRRRIAVEWESVDFSQTDPETGRAAVRHTREIVPAAALRSAPPLPDDRHGDGLRDAWKLGHGLDLDSAAGPDGPWGDPDGDGLPNWQEQLAGTDPVKADTEGRSGLVRWEIWRDIPGRYVFDLRRAPHFPAGPRETRFLDRLEIPVGNGLRYGARVRGWLVAPEDGEYRIGIDAGDEAELWLGENESWQSKRLVARGDQHVLGRPRWFRQDGEGRRVPRDSDQIARVTLSAGRHYYLEILHKQDTGSDFCTVSWIRPGAERAEPIAGKHLVAWRPSPEDADDDGLPDAWQRSAGLPGDGVDPAARHAEADPDGDGATNREEWLAGTDPMDPADFPETGRKLTSEAWSDIPGRRIADLVDHPRFPAEPDFTTRVDNLDFGSEGGTYGVRMRGYLTAPEDGPYHFAIAGNHAGILLLGESEDKFTRRAIARVEHGSAQRFFSADPRQRGGPVELRAGRRYHIEMLFKRGATVPELRGDEADHSSVAWTRPGRKESVIGPEFLSPYRPDPRDLDDDDLPDDWEILHGLDPADPAGDQGAWGDPDGDGLENFREFRLGLDPGAADVHGTPGLALWEYWDDREDLMPALRDHGGTLADRLREDPRHPLDPVRREWRDTLESPRGVDVNYASRMRAVIVAPETGDYVFAISSHHAGQLFLSPDESKFNRRAIASIDWASRYREWHNHESQTSAPVRLEAGGRYYIEALHAQGRNPLRRDHLCVAWKLPGSDDFEVIGAESLIAFFRDPDDQDDDDLPDDWENRHGLDSADPRGDHGPDGDLDGDGLTNMREYLLGTHPNDPDTDGDGVSDRDETTVYGTDPLNRDAVPPELLAELPLETVASAPGEWMIDGGGALVSTALRGGASFGFHIDRPGLHLVRLVARSTSATDYAPPIPIAVFVNGGEIGTGVTSERESTLSWMTPWLEAGDHVVTLENRNAKFFAGLEISSVELLLITGEDLDGNGIPDWIETRMRSLSGFDAPVAEVLRSAVSPACVEGIARLPGSVSLSVDGENHPVLPAIGDGWYANIPLAASGETVLNGTFEGGTFESSLRLLWEALDPFETAERLKVRAGDSLKFAVPTSGEATAEFALTLDGEEIHAGPAGTEVVVRFDRAGERIVEVSLSGAGKEKTRRITVDAIAADFGPAFSLAAENDRVWNLPGVPPDLALDSDPRLFFDDHAALAPEGRRVTARWLSASAGKPVVLARLGEDGPIVASTRLNVFRLVDAAESGDAHVVDILADGTRVVEISYLIEGEIPPDFSMWIDFLVTDAVFEDGSTRYRLTAADFDGDGVARVKIYKAPGDGPAFVCHWNHLFGDDDGDDGGESGDGDDNRPEEE